MLSYEELDRRLMNWVRQVDEDDIRILARAVEDDLLAVGRDVEGQERAVIVEAGELTDRSGGEIQPPEIQRGGVGHEHQTVAVR